MYAKLDNYFILRVGLGTNTVQSILTKQCIRTIGLVRTKSSITQISGDFLPSAQLGRQFTHVTDARCPKRMCAGSIQVVKMLPAH